MGARRARLTYMRKPKHDMGSVQNIVLAYQRSRGALRGSGLDQQKMGRELYITVWTTFIFDFFDATSGKVHAIPQSWWSFLSSFLFITRALPDPCSAESRSVLMSTTSDILLRSYLCHGLGTSHYRVQFRTHSSCTACCLI